MGSSMGGLASCYALTQYPEIFGGGGCISTHFPLGDGFLVDYYGAELPKAGTHKIYFDFGTETLDAGYEPFQRKMDQQLEQKLGYQFGEDYLTLKFEGHEHSETAWKKRVELPLRFLLGNDETNTNWKVEVERLTGP